MIKNLFCTPKLRSTATTKTSRRLSPAMSLLDRLREAVFRLIMLSALSKGHRRSSVVAQPPDYHQQCYYPHDPHHSEAVADCIEFIKKSATAGGGHEDSAAAAAHVVLPVPPAMRLS